MAHLSPHHLTLGVLATVLGRIAAGYRERGLGTIDLSERDFYRVIGTDEMFDIYAGVPTPIGIGSLHDDIAELSKAQTDPEFFPTAVDVERLGNVLRAVSEVIASR